MSRASRKAAQAGRQRPSGIQTGPSTVTPPPAPRPAADWASAPSFPLSAPLGTNPAVSPGDDPLPEPATPPPAVNPPAPSPRSDAGARSDAGGDSDTGGRYDPGGGQSTQSEPALAPAPGDPTTAQATHVPARTRASSAYVGVGVILLVLIIVLDFIVQNLRQASVHFFTLDFRAPIGVLILGGAIAGGLMVLLVSLFRVVQLRRTARRQHAALSPPS